MTKSKIKSTGGSTGYYDLPTDATCIQDLIEHKSMGFSLGNIFKACYRLGEKNGIDELYDVNKIIWYAERIKARIEKGKLDADN